MAAKFHTLALIAILPRDEVYKIYILINLSYFSMEKLIELEAVN